VVYFWACLQSVLSLSQSGVIVNSASAAAPLRCVTRALAPAVRSEVATGRGAGCRAVPGARRGVERVRYVSRISEAITYNVPLVRARSITVKNTGEFLQYVKLL
jgi:hypothetical protein